jgi:SAM-dependent methyltransferase
VTYNDDWEREARNWIAWARTPGHDAYWLYSPLFFELVPHAARATLDVGCGEGRVSRDLALRGHRVTAIDSSPTLLDAAREADPSGNYVLADAAALPFADGSFDLVVAYNSLMDVHDMPGAVAEAARVLEPGGRFCVCVTHPLMDAGSFETHERGDAFVIRESYFGKRRYEGACRRAGLEITFRGWCYALQDYSRALEAAGLAIEALREPPIPAERVREEPRDEVYRRVPMFLFLRARRNP